jgi:hypothetical protein
VVTLARWSIVGALWVIRVAVLCARAAAQAVDARWAELDSLWTPRNSPMIPSDSQGNPLYRKENSAVTYPYQPPPNGPQYPPVYYPYPAPPQPQNGLGTAGFVCGLIAAVFCWVPLIGVVAWPLSLVGLPLSWVGASRADRGEATNRGLALAGAILSVIALGVCVIWVIAAVA